MTLSCPGTFGAPLAHNDDPIRAVHAALEIIEDVKNNSERFSANITIEGPGGGTWNITAKKR